MTGAIIALDGGYSAQLRVSVAILDTPPLPYKIREKIEAVAESTPPLVIRPWEWNR